MTNLEKIQIKKLHDYMAKSSKPVIVAHTHPDGDAIGSSVSIMYYLKEILGKDAHIVLPDPLSPPLEFVISSESKPYIHFHSTEKTISEQIINEADAIFCLDCNAFNRTGDLENILKESKATKILIDHHLNPDTDSFDLVFSEQAISSASEYLFWILMAMPEIDRDASKLPKESARSSMIGMTTDSNNFANSVYPTTFEMASKLIQAGVDRDDIIQNLYFHYRENRVRIMGYVLDKLLKISDKGVAYIILSKADMERFDIAEGETEGFVNIPLSIDKVRMSMFLREDNGYFRVSLRSKKGTSSNLCAQTYFNGGGHELASGGKVFIPKDIATADDIEKYVLDVINKYFD